MLSSYIENVARGRLADLTDFVDAIDELGPNHPIKWLEVTRQIMEDYNDLDFTVRSADGFLTTYMEIALDKDTG